MNEKRCNTPEIDLNKVSELAIDPRWRMVTVNINGRQAAVLQVVHPRHGLLSFFFPTADLPHLIDAIVDCEKGLVGG